VERSSYNDRDSCFRQDLCLLLSIIMNAMGLYPHCAGEMKCILLCKRHYLHFSASCHAHRMCTCQLFFIIKRRSFLKYHSPSYTFFFGMSCCKVGQASIVGTMTCYRMNVLGIRSSAPIQQSFPHQVACIVGTKSFLRVHLTNLLS
jgi:hypothetical protein